MSEKPSVTDRKRASTRRRTLQTIGGIVLGSSAIGTAAANRHITEINGPTVIDEPGEYVLTANISNDGGNRNPIIQIEADRVTLDGNGHTISHEEGAGIRATNVTNVTVSDLSLTDLVEQGCLRITDGRNCTIEQIAVADAWAGIRCGGRNNTLQQNTVRFANRPIRVSGSDNTLQGNTILGHYSATVGRQQKPSEK